METSHKGRRKLIKALILSVISLPIIGRFLIPVIKHQKVPLRIKKEEVPGGGALIFGQKKIAVIKENQDIYALNLTCTHLGCTVNATTKGFACPCHGSVFTTRGDVVKGPADGPLKRLAVENQGDDVLILKSL
ncbi:MAG: Rieske 2Fe-2S domain-containing protein [Deltaproteobacteria bacterium]|nr:Rieske 2Fe-2S domain-containing protein [Deltaproteobacteria bacterium]